MSPVMAKDVLYVPSANGRKKKTPPSVIEARVIEALSKLPYSVTYLGFVGDYIGVKSKVALSCECGREFTSNAGDVISKGSGCRACCVRKYNNLYSPCLYVLRCGEIGKVGITENIRERFSQIRNRTQLDFKLIHREELPDIETARRKEKLIKKWICAGGVFDIPEGSTETFRFSQKQLNNIMNLARVG
ncbi:hypothetical protein AIG27_04540 [Salmonella enterica subsp. enterica]|nr:hypothetical protein [Salmonella enterica subsp. enterica]EDT7115450.1 hypothetical protein [Salmonella enterica subsp. enterica]EDW2006440.1 hypothetical protein [Salmonella enterica subsp. enterica]EEC0393361.1 hypothetical protein [Salmonella enterica subsp. enterica]EED4536188.1 hypothetical protein [Salmonella enterica subsp. enterica]